MKFTDCIEIVGSKPTLYEGTKQYVSTGAVEEYFINEKSIEEYSYKERPSRADLVGKSGDILFAKMAETKKTLILDKETENYLFSTGFFAIRPKNGILTTKCLYYLLNSKNFLNQKDKNSSGATQKAITNAGLEKINVNIPLFFKQDQIVKQFDLLTDIIKKYQSQLKKLDTLIKSRFIEMFGNPQCILNNWKVNPLSDYCIVNPKKSELEPIPDDYELSFIPMQSVSENGDVDTSSIKHYKDVKTGFTYFRENDVLFAKITPCMENGKGGVARKLKNQIGFGSTEFHVLRPIETISNSEWIYRLTTFKTFRKDAENNMTGSAGQRRTPKEFFDKYKVGLPPIELQNDFAAFVQQIDKSKFAVQKSLEKAETLYKSLMQEYFG